MLGRMQTLTEPERLDPQMEPGAQRPHAATPGRQAAPDCFLTYANALVEQVLARYSIPTGQDARQGGPR